MTERKRIQRALEPLHASDDTLEEVFAMIERDKAVKHLKHTGRNTLRTVTVAAALVLALSVTAYAVGEYTGFFETVFGDEDAGKQTYDLPLDSWDDEGNQRTMEIVTEGQPVDQETAQRVLDGSVAGGASVTAGGVTCAVENIVLADNGVGALTYTVEAPDGLPDMTVTDQVWGYFYWDDGYDISADGDLGLLNAPLLFIPGDGGMVDERTALVSATETKIEATVYMALFGDETWPDALDVYFFLDEDQDRAEAYKLTLALPEPAQTTVLTADGGWTAKLSPMGLVIEPPADNPYGNDYGFGDLVVHMTDGSEYVVELAEPYTVNSRVGTVDGGIKRWVFNRLVDPAAVESVTAVGDGNGYQDADGSPVPYDQAWVEVEPELVGDTWTSSTALREGLTEMNVALDLTFTK